MRAAWGRARVWTPPRAARTVVTGPRKAGSDIERVVTLIDARAARYDRTPHRITTGPNPRRLWRRVKKAPADLVDSTLPWRRDGGSRQSPQRQRRGRGRCPARGVPTRREGRPAGRDGATFGGRRSSQIGQQQRIRLGHQRRRVPPSPAPTPAGRRRPVRGGEVLTRRRREAPDAPAAVVEARVGRGRRGRLLGRLTHHDVDEPDRSRPARQGAGTRAHAPA